MTDSDSDSFPTLKGVSKAKSNGASKSTKPGADGPRQGVKVEMKSPVKPPLRQSKAAKSPVTPKSTEPPPPKKTPTSVLDYFGNAAVQRSEKKLVASVKRKVVSVVSSCVLHWFHLFEKKKISSALQPTQDRDDPIADLQMDDDMEVRCSCDHLFGFFHALFHRKNVPKKCK